MHFMVPNVNKDTLAVERNSLQDVWRDMEKCFKQGLTRSIGVSNCSTVMLMDLLSFCEIKPCSNQIEIHPYLVQHDVHELHHELGIPLEAYSPLNP